METYILRENVLSDDVLLLADEGKIFKGGYLGIVEYYTYQNAWSDKKHIAKFKNKKRLVKFIAKNYKDFNLQQI